MLKKRVKEQESERVKVLENQLARALADYDNFKKRVDREREGMYEAVTGRVVSRFLPILDMLISAQNHLQDTGVALTIKEFEDTLKEEGLEPIEPTAGDEFNEELHEAVDTSVKEGLKEGQIISTSLRGWRFKEGQVIRHAKVVVNKKN